MPNLARIIDVVFADLPIQQRAWLWAMTDPDLCPTTATGKAADLWAEVYGIKRNEGETDEDLRGRMHAKAAAAGMA